MGDNGGDNNRNVIGDIAGFAWSKIPLRYKIIGGGAVALFAIIILLVFGGMSNLNFLDYSSSLTDMQDIDDEEFWKNYEEYWYELCDEHDSSCTQAEIERAKETVASQKKFYEKLEDLSKKNDLSVEQRYIILTTVFFGVDFDYFSEAGGAFTLTEDSEEEDWPEEGSNIYEEEADTLKELVKQFKIRSAECYMGEDGTSYMVKDSSGKNFEFSWWEYFFPNDRERVLEYKEAVSKCEGKIRYKFVASTDKFYAFLRNSTYFDKKERARSYYNDYARQNGLAVDNISSWPESDRIAVREQIIDLIKSEVEYYMEVTMVKETQQDIIAVSNNGNYWWPIGSSESTVQNGVEFASSEPPETKITSLFGYRIHPIYGMGHNHSGIDIAGLPINSGKVIAAKSGKVVHVETGCLSYGDKKCGSGYGNNVRILHDDGKYTLYAHLHQGTITVKEGDTVMQGQVIALIGSSGSSTGPHLHFEMRNGPDTSSRIDPLDYVDPENPRPVAVNVPTSDFITMLNGLEGGPTATNGNYIVECNPNDVPTVGHGVTLTYDKDYFTKYGITLTTNNGYYNYCNTEMPADVVDRIYYDVIDSHANSVKNILAKNGITNLTQAQIDALTSLHYNCGNINGFVDAYRTYGATESLCQGWFIGKSSGGTYANTLHRRRRVECDLFVYGVYSKGYTRVVNKR